jgi:hexosaminidase
MVERKRYNKITALTAIIMLIFQVTGSAKTPSDLSKAGIIPKPVSVTATGKYFTFRPGTGIYVQGETAELKQIGLSLAERLKPATGFEFEVKTTEKTPRPGNIYIRSRCKTGG